MHKWYIKYKYYDNDLSLHSCWVIKKGRLNLDYSDDFLEMKKEIETEKGYEIIIEWWKRFNQIPE